MSQFELTEFFIWCNDTLENFHVQDCDESQHYYLGVARIGGWAGDSRDFFLDDNDLTQQTTRRWLREIT